MRKIIFTLFVVHCLVFHEISYAQAPPVQWARCYGGFDPDQAYSAEETNDGGYIIAGYSMSTSGDVSGNYGASDYWVVKTDMTGSIEWQHCFGGSNDDVLKSIHQTSDHGYILAGFSFSNDSDVSGNNGYDDYWIVKLDSNGTIQWQKSLGGSSEEQPSEIRQTADSGFIISGYTYSNNYNVSGNHDVTGITKDIWIVKINSIGNLIWQKCFGGSADDYANDIGLTSDGNYIVAGISSSTDGDVSVNQSGMISWIFKIDTVGNILWQNGRTYFPSADTGFVVSRILEKADGGYVIAGELAWFASLNYFIFGMAFLDSTGNFIYARGNGYYGHGRANAINKTSDNGYILCGVNDSAGNLNNEWLIVKTDSAGQQLWQQTFNSTNATSADDVAYSAHETTDGGFIIGGHIFNAFGTSCNASAGNSDFGLAKLGGTSSADENLITEKNLAAYLSPLNDLLVSFSYYEITDLHLAMLDITGRNLFQSQFTSTPGINKKEIPIGDLAKGIYIVTLTGAEGSESVKVVKE